MREISKMIDELELMVLMKKLEIELDQDEIKELKSKIEAIEYYIDTYDNV